MNNYHVFSPKEFPLIRIIGINFSFIGTYTNIGNEIGKIFINNLTNNYLKTIFIAHFYRSLVYSTVAQW